MPSNIEKQELKMLTFFYTSAAPKYIIDEINLINELSFLTFSE